MPKDDDAETARLEIVLAEARQKLDAGIMIAGRRKLTNVEAMELAVLEDMVRGLAKELGQDLLRRPPYVARQPKPAPISAPGRRLRLVKK